MVDKIEILKETYDELLAPGGGFSWSVQEVRGMPMRVFDAAPPNMRAIWELSAPHGDKTYLVFEDESYSYAEIHAQVRSLAHALVNDYGVAPGERVAIAMRNYPEWITAYWATISIGAAAVGMNAWWTGPEMTFAVNDSAPKVMIADTERIERLAPHLDELTAESPLSVIAVRFDGELPADAAHWSDVVKGEEAPGELPEVEIHPDDDSCIFYTSGTTGFPKGAQLTHRGSVHNVFHMAFNLFSSSMAGAKVKALEAAEAGEEPPPPVAPGDPVIMLPTPLFHVTANNCVLHPGTMIGAKLVLLYKWNPERALELIEREKVTTFTGVPTMSRELLLSANWDKRDTSSLESMGGGGAALQPDLVEKIDQAKGEVAPSTGYGLTETHGIVTAVNSMFYTAKPTSVGTVCPTFEAKLLDPDGNELPLGSIGELAVKGPAVIKGYINRPEATAEAIVDGWFRTGDLVTIDEDGFVHVVDRAKDIVIRGGENVYCSEVEAAIYEHPAVAEVAVIPVPDDRLGELVGAAIVLRPGLTLDEAELKAHLDGKLATFKQPEQLWILDEPLPRNANGKFLKRELKEQLTT